MSSTVISLSEVTIPSLVSVGTLCLPCCIDRMLGSSMVEYSLCTLPILSYECRKMYFRSSVLWMVLWSCNWAKVLCGHKKGIQLSCGPENSEQLLF